MSSDEEQRLEARKKAKKDKTVEQARIEAEQENAKRNAELDNYKKAREGAVTRALETAKRLKA